MKRLTSLDCVLEQLQRALGVTPSADLSTRQVRAFLMICKASIEGDPLTTEDLRRLLNLASQTAHNTVTYFVDRELITRDIATFDGRAKHLQLTDKGRNIAESLDNSVSVNAFADAFRTKVTDSKDLFKELLNGTE